MQSLGFTNLVDYQIGVDAHALNGDDQSIFSSNSLLFGEGGVDDAEDADVIIHEYGHAILSSAAPGTWSGFERQSLEEGLGDYLATSYSRDINPFNWQNMFSWDGHNPFWNGRNTASTKLYPTDLGFDMHLASEIWSSALMQIWGDIGRTTTDQILLQSLYSYAAGMTMVDAAYLFLQADSLLNGGVNYCVIYQRFEDRGFLPPIPFLCAYISSSSDVTCNGNCDGIAQVNTKGGTAPFSYLWDDSLSQTTVTATGLCANFYTVKVIDFNGDTAFSTVVINETIVNSDFTSTTFISGRVAFKYTSTGATDWFWSFGDGNTSISENPIHIYDSIGTYDVMLIVSDGGNCADTSTGLIEILYAPVGIYEPNENGSLSLFPNPTSGKFKVQYNTKYPQALSIRIYNMIGQIVDEVIINESVQLKKDKYVFDISNQANGVYFLNIKTPRDVIHLKLVKVH